MDVWAWVGALLMVALAGCISEDSTSEPGSPDDQQGASTSSTGDGAEGDDDEPPVHHPHQASFYFSADGLVWDVPESGSEAIAGSFGSCFVTQPCDWNAYDGPVASTSYRVLPETITIVLWISADQPVLSSQLFDFAVWFGREAENRYVAIHTMSAGPMMPGEPQELVLEVESPGDAGFHVLPGESSVAMVASAMLDEDLNFVRIHYGEDTPSRIEFTHQFMNDPPIVHDDVQSQQFTGSLDHGAFLVSDVKGDGFSADHVVTLGENASKLEVVVTRTGETDSPADIDLELWDGSTRLTHAGSPGWLELTRIVGVDAQQLSGRDVTIRVILFSGAQVGYEVRVFHD